MAITKVHVSAISFRRTVCCLRISGSKANDDYGRQIKVLREMKCAT